jgi:hypothetical protein
LINEAHDALTEGFTVTEGEVPHVTSARWLAAMKSSAGPFKDLMMNDSEI